MPSVFWWTTYALLWILVAALFVAVFFIYRYLGQGMLNSGEGRARQGPETGGRLPNAQVRDLRGEVIPLLGPRDRPIFLLFTSVTCDACQQSLVSYGTFAQRHGMAIDMLLICGGGSSREVAAFTAGLPDTIHVVPDTDWRLGGQMRVSSTPFALIADQRAVVVGKGMPTTAEGFAWFIEQLEVAAGTRPPVVVFQPSKSKSAIGPR